MIKTFKFGIILVLVVTLFGCASVATMSDADAAHPIGSVTLDAVVEKCGAEITSNLFALKGELREGISQCAVRYVLGAPDEVRSLERREIWIYRSVSSVSYLQLSFINGKLAFWTAV